MSDGRRSAQDPSWRQYPNTVLHLPDRSQIDLRHRMTRSDLDRMQRAGLPARFVVITAFNPFGQVLPRATNLERHARLIDRIASMGLSYLSVSGGSPDGSHIEDGVAVGLEVSIARQIAAEFEQSAFFSFDGQRFWLVAIDAPEDAIELPQ